MVNLTKIYVGTCENLELQAAISASLKLCPAVLHQLQGSFPSSEGFSEAGYAELTPYIEICYPELPTLGSYSQLVLVNTA